MSVSEPSPGKVDTIEEHHMHSEFYMVEESEAKKINDTKDKRRTCDLRWNHKLPYPGIRNR